MLARRNRQRKHKYRQGRTEMEKKKRKVNEMRERLKWIERGKLKNREKELEGGLLRGVVG